MPKQVPPIDDDIYTYVQDHAVPLEDDFNSVLRRLLGLSEEVGHQKASPASPTTRRPTRSAGSRGHPRPNKRGQKRAPKGSLLPEDAYELPILRALVEQGGRAPTSEVVDRVGDMLDGKLAEVDRATLKSGDVRWRNRAQFVRLALIKSGDLVDGSPRGIWEISDQGRRRVEENSQ